jgi:hypothetical protein
MAYPPGTIVSVHLNSNSAPIGSGTLNQHNEPQLGQPGEETMVVMFGPNPNHTVTQVGSKVWLNVGHPPAGLAANVRAVNGTQVTFAIKD